MPDRPKPEFVTIPQAAKRLGIGVKLLRRRARGGAFPVYRPGTSWPRVRIADVERWVDSTRIRVTDDDRAFVDEVISGEGTRG